MPYTICMGAYMLHERATSWQKRLKEILKMAVGECAHAGCHCSVIDREDYCGVYCRDALDSAEGTCNCGHLACSVEISIKA
jgi:hypothetical protein